MRILLSVVVGIALVFGAGAASSEGAEPKLPTEGTWAKYHAITKESNGEERIATFTLKSLGKVVVDDQPCRWLESEYVASDGKRHERRKTLISERAIESSLRPMDDALRCLQQNDAERATSLPPESQAWMASDFLHFPGFLKNAKRVDELRTVNYQRGALEIFRAHVGTYRWWRKDKEPDETVVWETEYRVWLHPDVPVGVAHAVTKLKLIREGKTLRTWQLDYALQDFGDGAEPAISAETAPSGMP